MVEVAVVEVAVAQAQAEVVEEVAVASTQDAEVVDRASGSEEAQAVVLVAEESAGSAGTTLKQKADSVLAAKPAQNDPPE